MKKKIETTAKKTTEKARRFALEFKKQTTTAIMTAFGLIIALVWKDVILKFLENITKPGIIEKYPYLPELYSAIIITAISVIGIIILSRWSQSPQKQE